jgi:hypothetical protein
MEVGAQLPFQAGGASWQPAKFENEYSLDNWMRGMLCGEIPERKECVSCFLLINSRTAIVLQPLHRPPGFSMTAPISIRYSCHAKTPVRFST